MTLPLGSCVCMVSSEGGGPFYVRGGGATCKIKNFFSPHDLDRKQVRISFCQIKWCITKLLLQETVWLKSLSFKFNKLLLPNKPDSMIKSVIS